MAMVRSHDDGLMYKSHIIIGHCDFCGTNNVSAKLNTGLSGES